MADWMLAPACSRSCCGSLWSSLLPGLFLQPARSKQTRALISIDDVLPLQGTIVVTRAVAHKVYPIPTVAGQINTIVAIGDTPQLSYHKARTGASITLVPSAQDACVCEPLVQTFLSYMNGQ